MSKADELGDSTSFGAVGRRRSRRGQLIDDVTDGGEHVHQDLAPPRVVPLTQLAHNPFNPRHDLRELQETAESLLEKGQIQPITVVTRAVFLRAHPGQEEAIGPAAYVVLDGNRRLGAARLAGLEELRVDVNDELAGSAEEMLESALVANIHREDLTPLEEAETLAKLTEVYGSQRQVARRVGKTHAWVSQRLALLALTPELQEELKSGSLTVEDGRRIGKLPQQRQAAAAEQVKAERAERKPGRTAGGGNAVTTPGSATPTSGNGVTTPSRASGIPWQSPEAMAVLLQQRMAPENIAILVNLLTT
jgi:ParB family chromosome partitioning protein